MRCDISNGCQGKHLRRDLYADIRNGRGNQRYRSKPKSCSCIWTNDSVGCDSLTSLKRKYGCLSAQTEKPVDRTWIEAGGLERLLKGIYIRAGTN